MSHPMVTFADAVASIGTLPSLAPRPCATNIRALTIDLIDKLTIIPSEQTADLGYSGLAEQDAVYALQTNTPWANFINPDQVPPTNDAWTSEQSRVARNLHDALSTQRAMQRSRVLFAGCQETGWGFKPSDQQMIQN